jgi:hypothetical protein
MLQFEYTNEGVSEFDDSWFLITSEAVANGILREQCETCQPVNPLLA